MRGLKLNKEIGEKMKLKMYNKKKKQWFDMDMYEEFARLLEEENCIPQFKKDIVFLRYAGQLCGIDIFEGDVVSTSDGVLTKEIKWVDKDYGFGPLYHLARYVEKTGCTIVVVDHVLNSMEDSL